MKLEVRRHYHPINDVSPGGNVMEPYGIILWQWTDSVIVENPETIIEGYVKGLFHCYLNDCPITLPEFVEQLWTLAGLTLEDVKFGGGHATTH